jgi:hypothetical protein
MPADGQQNPDSRRNGPADNAGRPADDVSINTTEHIMKNIVATITPADVCKEHPSTHPAGAAAWRNTK